MVDRRARDRMASLIRSYMNDEINAADLDARLSEAGDSTQDRAVDHVRRVMWAFYDDFVPHRIVADRGEWDSMSRLLLLLDSDAELEVAGRSWRWSWRQPVAAVLLALFLIIAKAIVPDERAMLVAMAFGPASILLDRVGRGKQDAHEIALAPFASVSGLLRVRRRVPGFVKRPYPRHLAGRRIRGPIMEALLLATSYSAWCLLSPIVLLVQSLPERVTDMRVRTPNGRAVGPESPKPTV